MVKPFTARDMFEELGAAQPNLTIVGFVRPCSGDDAAIDFAVPGTCDEWVKIPEALVDGFEALSRSKGAAHEHDLVRLHLKRPDDATAGALHDLIGGQVKTMNKALLSEAAASAKAGAQYCYYDATGKYVCVPI
jgi:hypothetical protein